MVEANAEQPEKVPMTAEQRTEMNNRIEAALAPLVADREEWAKHQDPDEKAAAEAFENELRQMDDAGKEKREAFMKEIDDNFANANASGDGLLT